VRPKGILGSVPIEQYPHLHNQRVIIFIYSTGTTRYFLISERFPTKIVLVRERIEVFANSALSSHQIGPYWTFWPLLERFAPFPIPRATLLARKQSCIFNLQRLTYIYP